MKKMYVLLSAVMFILLLNSANVYATGYGENPEYSFVTTDGNTVTTKANGKPKILIFTMPTCGPCNRLIQEITDNSTQYSSYDVLVIDVTGSSLENIKAHKQKFGTTPIVFCVDENRVGFNYKYKLENELTIGTPYSVFVNSNNEIVNYYEGYSSDYFKVTCNSFGVTTTEKTVEQQSNYCSLSKVKGIKATKKKNKTIIKWKKLNDCVTGYQIQYSKSKNFKKKVSSDYVIGTTRYTINGKAKKMYIRIRPYVNSGGENVYGPWVIKKI